MLENHRRLGWACIVALCAGAVGVAPAVADDICTAIAPLAPWVLIGRSTSLEYRKINYGWGAEVRGNTCVEKARLRGSSHDGEVVAVASRGTAVKLKYGLGFGYSGTYREPVYIAGSLITGGGYVRGTPSTDYDTGDPVDTTGTSPELDGCQAALDAMEGISANLAALPPTRVFGPTLVSSNQEFVLHLAPGEVVNMDSLVSAPSRLGQSYGYVPDCTYPDEIEPPHVLIHGGPAVVNVARLELGGCNWVEISGNVVMNVPGSGRAVRVGFSDDIEGPILAPRRSVNVVGTANDDPTFTGSLWAKKLSLLGYVIPQPSLLAEDCRP